VAQLGGCGSGRRPAQVTMRPKSGVVVAVVTGSRLQCRPRVRPGFGDFLGPCTDSFFLV
jgi:hypothetical protein